MEHFEQERNIEIIKKTIVCLMAAFVFLMPFPHTTAIREICFYISGLLFVGLIIVKQSLFYFRSPFTVTLLLFASWSFLGLFFALNKPNSIEDFYSHLVRYIIFYFILINSFDSKKGFLTIVHTLIASASIFSITCGIYFYAIEENPVSSRIDFKEFQINIIGFLTIISFLFSINLLPRYRQWHVRIWLIISIISTAVITLLTQSISTVIALMVSLLILSLNKTKIVLCIGFVIVISLFFFPVKERINPEALERKIQGDDRYKIALTYYEMIKDYPVTGIGYGMQMWYDETLWEKYSQRLPEDKRAVMQDPHNIVVSVAVRTGIVGLILYFYLFIIYGKMVLAVSRSEKNHLGQEWVWTLVASMAVYLVKGMFEPALTNVPIYICYILFALITIVWRLNSSAFDEENIKGMETHS
ncbi:MAG: O-antigen ligase family protein [Syntrophales bacterium]|nr:O-antigen ligase family protein [Syntrophales bacterium]MDY0043511.1 O-antigen ligase family protein [Syntrophales bacterium]